MTREEILQALKEHIAQHILNGEDVGLDGQTPLLEWGILNSIEIMRLLSFIAERFHVNISPGKLTANNFNTLDSITGVVEEGLAEISTAQ
jgi:acyl carrier protein